MVDEDKWLEITSLTNLLKTSTTTSTSSAVIEEMGGEGKENDEKMDNADSKRLDLELEKSTSSGEKHWNCKSSSSVMSLSPAFWPLVAPPYDNLQSQSTTCLSSKKKIPVNKRQRKMPNPPHNVLLNLDFNEKINLNVNDVKRLNHQHCVRNPKNHSTSKHSCTSISSSNVNGDHLKLSEAPPNSHIDENNTKKNHHVGNGDGLKDNDKVMDSDITENIENMKSRLLKLTTLLADKIKIIEQQEINIGNLHRKLAAQTTESLWNVDYCDSSGDYDSEDNSIHEETSKSNEDSRNDKNDQNMEVQNISNFKKIETRHVHVQVHDGIQEKMDIDQHLSATDNYDNNNHNNNNDDNNNNTHEMKKDDKSSIKDCTHCKNRRRMSKKNMMMMKKMEGETTKTKIYPLLLDDRLDTLEKKMDHLEAELPKRIQAICAEFIKKSGLLECPSSSIHHFDSNTTATTTTTNNNNNICPCKACREIAAMTVEDEREDNMEFCTMMMRTNPSQKKKLNPMVSIMRKFCDKTQSLSNPPPPPLLLPPPPQNPLKWNKSPIIKPKTNLSANYRFLHHLNHQQQRDSQFHEQGPNAVKIKKTPHIIEKTEETHNVDDDIIGDKNGFDFRIVEEKLCSIENVVDKFKHYLISLLLNRFKS